MSSSYKTLAGTESSTASSSSSTSPLNGNHHHDDGYRREKPQQPHVLAVDDSHLDRILVANLLRKSSCKVTIVENAMEALEYLGLLGGGDSDDIIDQQQESSSSSDAGHHQVTDDNKVHLILSDYCMPEMTGYDLLKKIKESSRMREVPFVIMSSESVPTRINQCLEGGAQMFIKKPLKLSDVQMMMLRCQVTKL